MPSTLCLSVCAASRCRSSLAFRGVRLGHRARDRTAKLLSKRVNQVKSERPRIRGIGANVSPEALQRICRLATFWGRARRETVNRGDRALEIALDDTRERAGTREHPAHVARTFQSVIARAKAFDGGSDETKDTADRRKDRI